MKDTLQNSRFHQLRLAAGYTNLAALAHAVGVKKITLYDWDHSGKKPRWRNIPKLAELFRTTPAELIESLWDEVVGTLCSCGCGNKKALPDYDGAQHLYIERICVNCGGKKLFRRPSDGSKHPTVCQTCHEIILSRSAPNRSDFRALRIAAEVRTSHIAKALDISIATVRDWDSRGHRPEWRYMEPLSKILKIDLPEAVKSIWRERAGDRCSCGCNGENIFPNYDRAIHLYTKRTCRCGVSRIFRTNQHTKGCNRCGLGDKMVRWVKRPCEGYFLYGSRKPSFAKNCRRTIDIRETDKKRRLCGRCTSALNIINAQEAHVKEFLTGAAGAFLRASTESKQHFFQIAGFYPHEQVPEIRSLKTLRILAKACHKLTYKDQSGKVVAYNPSVFLAGVKKPHSGDSRPRSVSYLKSMLAGQCRRRVLPRYVRGLCLLCDKIMLSNGGMKGKPPRVHEICLYEYQRLNGPHARLPLSPLDRRRGVRPSLENLQRHWGWTIRHKLGGDSLLDIAKEFRRPRKNRPGQYPHITKQTVADAIEFVMDHLPPLEFVADKYQKRISLLKSDKPDLT